MCKEVCKVGNDVPETFANFFKEKVLLGTRQAPYDHCQAMHNFKPRSIDNQQFYYNHLPSIPGTTYHNHNILTLWWLTKEIVNYKLKCALLETI